MKLSAICSALASQLAYEKLVSALRGEIDNLCAFIGIAAKVDRPVSSTSNCVDFCRHE